MTEAFSPVFRRVPEGGPRREWQSAEVLEVRPETPRASTFRLALPAWTRHVPGQHCSLRLVADDGYTAQRDYSIASAPDDEGVVELTVDLLEDGEVSGYLHEVVQPGDRLDVRGPFGGFFVWKGDVPALLVGGGSGVVPLMAMVRHARRRPGLAPVRLVQATRTAQDVYYKAEQGPETTALLSREDAPGRPASRLTVEDLAPLVQPGQEAYVCGSDRFAEAAAALLVEAGQPEDRIRIERFGAGSAG